MTRFYWCHITPLQGVMLTETNSVSPNFGGLQMQRRAVFAAVLVLGLLFAACGNEEPTATPGAQETTEAPTTEDGTVEITAVEYAFNVPATLPAGSTTFTLTNSGEERHFIDIVQLTEDAPPVEELIKLPDRKVGKFFIGQPNHIRTVKPGETSKPLEIELESGARYGYVCFFSKKGEQPHAFQGMFGEFTVE